MLRGAWPTAQRPTSVLSLQTPPNLGVPGPLRGGLVKRLIIRNEIPFNLPADSDSSVSPEVVSALTLLKAPRTHRNHRWWCHEQTRTRGRHWTRGSGRKRPWAFQKDQGAGQAEADSPPALLSVHGCQPTPSLTRNCRLSSNSKRGFT